VDHSTINRWVLKYAAELDKRIRPHLKPTNDSWRVDETYIKAECRGGAIPPPNHHFKKKWKYLYRAVDSQGNKIGLSTECQTRCALQQSGSCVGHSVLLTLKCRG